MLQTKKQKQENSAKALVVRYRHGVGPIGEMAKPEKSIPRAVAGKGLNKGSVEGSRALCLSIISVH